MGSTIWFKRGMEEENPENRKPLQGKILKVTIEDEMDLQRTVNHQVLTKISVDAIGLEFESERTAKTDIPLQMLLLMASQDIRENAAQIVNVEGGDGREETSKKLLTFFEAVDNLFISFPWEITMQCPMGLASIEGRGEESDVTETAYTIEGTDPIYERTCAAFAEMAFELEDEKDENNE